MSIAVPVSADSSLDGSRSKQVKFSIPANKKVNIFPLRNNIVQELVKAVLYFRSALYIPMPKKADRKDIHAITPNR